MKLAARAVTALALLALATPAMPCGFEKSHSTTTTSTPAAATGGQVAKADKERPARVQKTKAPAAPKAPATASN